ncbi:MAG: ABC transporter ATP-binding protein [Limisphaerales bacterium]
MNEPLLSAKGLCKTYLLGRRSLDVLRGVDIELRRGDFLTLRGASGSGKSTLLHLLGGLDSPTRGEVWLKGRNLAKLSRRELARARNQDVGFIFQAYYLLPELDALENVCLPARMARRPVAATEARARELLGRVGLAERLEHKPYELSGGEQQRVAIARALINEPALILADEPTGNLDSHTGEQIMQLLCALPDAKLTALIMATHDPRLAARAPRSIELVDGQIMGD